MPAVLIPSLIGAGASLAGAKVASNASKNAARTQQQAGQQALQAQQQSYQQQRQDFAPYQQAGQQALGRLQGMAGQPAAQPAVGQLGNGPMRQASPMGLIAQAAAPMGGMLSQGGGMVTVQAPDGSTRQMPQALAQQFVQKGARILG